MKPIPQLSLQHREIVREGKDYFYAVFKRRAPLWPDGILDRLETWKRLTKKETQKRRKICFSYLETHCDGTKHAVEHWCDNSRLAIFEGAVWELISSKSTHHWR